MDNPTCVPGCGIVLEESVICGLPLNPEAVKLEEVFKLSSDLIAHPLFLRDRYGDILR